MNDLLYAHRKAQERNKEGKMGMFVKKRHIGLLFSDLFFDAASWFVNHVVKASIGTGSKICQEFASSHSSCILA